MLEQLQDIIDYLNENMSDPVPQYILRKEIMHQSLSETDISMRKESKWYQQLAAEQWDNGSWGRFHTQDTKSPSKQKFPTTEAAIRRACELSLEKNDVMINKTIRLMERYIQGQEEWLDTNEHHYGFHEAFRTLVAANLSLFAPRHPLVQEKKEIVVNHLSKSLKNGSMNEETWEKENRSSHELFLRPDMVYVVWLLQQNDYLDQTMERAYLKYIWYRKEGIYYRTDGPSSDFISLESKSFLTWLTGLESLSDFTLFPEFMSMGASVHLRNEIHRLMYDNVALPKASPISGHYSETWLNKNARRNDLILRILRVLIKC
jgi:hypothetical protein